MSETKGEYDVAEVQTTGVHSDIGRFAIVPEWLLDTEVSAGAIRLFAVLAAKYADRVTNTGFPRRKVLADSVGVSVETLDKCMAQLIDVGAVRKEQRHSPDGDQISNLYHLRYSPPSNLPIPHPENFRLATQENSDTYPESGNQNQITNPPGEGFATEVASPSPAPKGAKRTKSVFTDKDRQDLIAKYQGQIQDPGGEIDRALNHRASDGWKDKRRGVDDWLKDNAPGGRYYRPPTGTVTASKNSAPAPVGKSRFDNDDPYGIKMAAEQRTRIVNGKIYPTLAQAEAARAAIVT